jgi:hypothetical protein
MTLGTKSRKPFISNKQAREKNHFEPCFFIFLYSRYRTLAIEKGYSNRLMLI